MQLTEHKKQKVEDKEIKGEVTHDFTQNELIRVYAVGITFTACTFKQAVLTNCYFRNCTFIRCDFTGTHIKDSYFKGSTFEGCQFKYATWEKTQLDEEFIDRCLPPENNLARDLIRSLRVNFAQTGNYEAVNRAAALEVKLTGQHLWNAAYSKQVYYRSKDEYRGIRRLWYGIKYAKWKFFDLLWGNGESILRVVISAIVFIGAATAWFAHTTDKVGIGNAFVEVFSGFWGVASVLPAKILLPLTISRLFFFGLFMAIIVKRLSRR